MVKQVSGFEIKVFVETKRQDTGPYHVGVNDGLVERGWMHDYGKGQVAYSGPVLKSGPADQRTRPANSTRAPSAPKTAISRP